jgi:hypothetical protein
VPVGRVFAVAFSVQGGGFTLVIGGDVFRTRLFRESVWNSAHVAGMSVVVLSLRASRSPRRSRTCAGSSRSRPAAPSATCLIRRRPRCRANETKGQRR